MTRRISTALWALLALGCSRASLEQVPQGPPPERDDQLLVQGTLCTRSPAERQFPLRVLFVVDASVSMAVTDPPDPATGETGRERAVRETWQRLLAEGDDEAKIGIVRFTAEARSRTPVDEDEDGLPDSFFTTNVDQLTVATEALRVTERTTNFLNAMDEAYYELRTEMLRADTESLPRSKYVVVFLSDGIPDVADQDARDNTYDNILDGVSALKDLATLFRVGEFAFHTVYLSTDQGLLLDTPAQGLLTDMAEVGGGTYRSVPNGEALDFLHIDLTALQQVFTLRSLVAVNTQSLPFGGQPVDEIARIDGAAYKDVLGDGLGCGDLFVDSDGDGLADAVEVRIGTDPLLDDTDGDGLGDRVEWRFRTSGLDPLDGGDAGCFVPDRVEGAGDGCVDVDADGFCDCPDLDDDGRCDYADTDGDRLRDCEEIFVGTSQTAPDSDADGLPDLLEFRVGTSAVDADPRGDLDWDGTDNASEAKSGGDPLCNDAALRSRTAYDYRVQETGLVADTTCYAFSVDRITLLPTLDNPAADYPGNGRNRILLFAGEASFDEPGAFAGWRMACVEARYALEGDVKSPPSGIVNLVDADFVAAEAFDPLVHCK